MWNVNVNPAKCDCWAVEIFQITQECFDSTLIIVQQVTCKPSI